MYKLLEIKDRVRILHTVESRVEQHSFTLNSKRNALVKFSVIQKPAMYKLLDKKK